MSHNTAQVHCYEVSGTLYIIHVPMLCHLTRLTRAVSQPEGGFDKFKGKVSAQLFNLNWSQRCTDHFSSLSDITSDKHRRSWHTNEMMKCVGASKCSNLNNVPKITRVNPNKLLSLIDPGKKMGILLSNEIEEGE